MKITIGNVTLFDHADAAFAGAALSGLDGSIQRLVDQQPVIDALEVDTADRGNKSTKLSFTVTLPNPSEEETLVSMFADEDQIQANQPLVITSTSGGVVITIPGTHESVRVRHSGTRSFHEYSYLGGKPVVTRPQNIRTTEDGTARVTEDGTARVQE